MFLLEEMGNTGSTVSGGLSSLTGLLGGLTGSGGSSGGLSALTGLLGSLTGGSGGSTGALSSITSLLSTFANASSGGGLDLSSILQSITGSSSSSSGGGIDVASILSKITGLVSGSNSQISDIIAFDLDRIDRAVGDMNLVVDGEFLNGILAVTVGVIDHVDAVAACDLILTSAAGDGRAAR